MLNLDGMIPAQRDLERGFVSTSADYFGGPLHGLLSSGGLHELRRSEYGRAVDADTASRTPHYRLYMDGSIVHYIHSTCLPPGNDLKDTPCE